MVKNKFITRKQYALLTNSQNYQEIAKEYTWLEEFFQNNNELTKEQVEMLPEYQKNFFLDNFYVIMKEAEKEWKGHKQLVDDLGENKSNWTTCSLCDTPNRYVHYIINQLNGIELNVGSRCIKYFDDIIKSYGISRSKLIKDAQTRRKILELNNAMPGVIRIIDDWNNILESYSIIIPNNIESPFIELGNSVNKLLDHFLHNKINIVNAIKELKRAFIQREKLIEIINSYVKTYEADRYAVTKSIERWVYNEANKEAIKNIKEDGIIKLRTAYRITEPGFMRTVAEDFKPILKNGKIKLIEVLENNKGYIMQSAPDYNINLFCSHKDLLITFGDHIFDKEPESIIDIKNLIKYCKINSDEESYMQFIDKLAYIIRNEDYVVFEMDYSLNSLTIHNKKDKKYLQFNLFEFANKFKEIVYGINTQTKKDIIRYVGLSNATKLSKDDYEALIDERYRDKDERKAFRSLRDRYKY